MTTLLDRAVTELKKRTDREQDDIARDILVRIGTASTHAHPLLSARGRGRPVITLADSSDTMIDILTADDIAAWYPDSDPANP